MPNRRGGHMHRGEHRRADVGPLGLDEIGQAGESMGGLQFEGLFVGPGHRPRHVLTDPPAQDRRVAFGRGAPAPLFKAVHLTS
jgi:hypothetical protein